MAIAVHNTFVQLDTPYQRSTSLLRQEILQGAKDSGLDVWKGEDPHGRDKDPHERERLFKQHEILMEFFEKGFELERQKEQIEPMHLLEREYMWKVPAVFATLLEPSVFEDMTRARRTSKKINNIVDRAVDTVRAKGDKDPYRVIMHWIFYLPPAKRRKPRRSALAPTQGRR